MTLRIFKYLFLGVFLLLILLLLIFVAGSKMSMDSNFSHTNATKDLPKFSPTIGNGIVNISIGDMTFRARIAGFDEDFSKKVVILLHGFPVTSALDPLKRLAIVWSHLINVDIVQMLDLKHWSPTQFLSLPKMCLQ